MCWIIVSGHFDDLHDVLTVKSELVHFHSVRAVIATFDLLLSVTMKMCLLLILMTRLFNLTLIPS